MRLLRASDHGGAARFVRHLPGLFLGGRPGAAALAGLAGGANRPSLIEAQANVKVFGACEERSVAHVRLPRDDEPLDPHWRSIDLERDHFERRGSQDAPRPDDRTVLYWWRYRDTGFWRRSGEIDHG